MELSAVDYRNVLLNISAIFLQFQIPSYSHTYIYNNKMYVVRYDEQDNMLFAPGLPSEDYYKFLAEFGLFALKETLLIVNANKLIIHANRLVYTACVVDKNKIGIKKSREKHT